MHVSFQMMKPLLTALMLGNTALFVFGALQHAGVAVVAARACDCGLRGGVHVIFEEGTWAAWLYDLPAKS